MSFAQIFLLVNATIAVAFGGAYLLFPVSMAALTELDLPTPTAVMDVRAFYGGQLIGLGVLALVFAARPPLVPYGLLVLAASLGGTGIGRLVGALVAGTFPPLMVGAFLAEIVVAALALALAVPGATAFRREGAA